MPALPLLAEPAAYRPCIQDLLAEGEAARNYWLDLFDAHLDTLAALPMPAGRLDDDPRWPTFRRDYLAGLAELRREPGRRGRLNILELTRFREERLAAVGIDDPFSELKQRENALALRALPALLREVDATPPGQRIELLIRGLLAGNLFDMGSKAAVDAYANSSAAFDFAALRARLPDRPWAVDDLDSWWMFAREGSRVGATPPPRRGAQERRGTQEALKYRRVLFFVDNAGPDVILGAIPLARALAEGGARVVLAANSRPALNDVTAAELTALLDACSRVDSRLAVLLGEGRLAVVDSGGDAPLLDLAEVSPACSAAAAESDLLILEGMGRAVESNYDARFKVDALKIALIKDRMVAGILGVELFDPVVRFEPARS